MRAIERPGLLTLGILAFGFAAFPAYPAFISMASISPPGVSLIPRGAAIVVLALCVLFAGILGVDAIRRRVPVPVTFWPICVYIAGWFVAALFGFDPATG